MKPRERIHQRFKQLGLRYLRVPESDAEVLAEAVSWSHDRLGALADFCLEPELRTPAINRAILVRWLETIPMLLPVPAILSQKVIPPWECKNFSGEGQERIYAAVSEVATGAMALTEPHASHFANCVRLSAGPAFAFYQRCMSPEEHTLEALAQSLVAYTGALPHAAAAYQLCIGRRAEG